MGLFSRRSKPAAAPAPEPEPEPSLTESLGPPPAFEEEPLGVPPGAPMTSPRVSVADVSTSLRRRGVAVIGGGYLGARIAAEMAICSVPVRIYDKMMAPDAIISNVEGAITEVERAGLLPPDRAAEARGFVQVAVSIAEAVAGVAFVSEAVVDRLDVKTAVFAEAAAACAPDAILTTNTLNIPLDSIQAAMPADRRVRLMGLRFLAPVVLVPFVEVTYIKESQVEEKEQLEAMLMAVQKTVFECPVDAVTTMGGANRYELCFQRLRLSPAEVLRHQAWSARLDSRRRERQAAAAEGGVAGAAKEEEEEEPCCVCLTEKRNALSLSCGHKVMCIECAKRVDSMRMACPICRVGLHGKVVVVA